MLCFTDAISPNMRFGFIRSYQIAPSLPRLVRSKVEVGAGPGLGFVFGFGFGLSRGVFPTLCPVQCIVVGLVMGPTVSHMKNEGWKPMEGIGSPNGRYRIAQWKVLGRPIPSLHYRLHARLLRN